MPGVLKTVHRSLILSVILWACILPQWATAQRSAEKNAGELQAALQKLDTLGSVLYIGAHPDDENTAVLAWLSKGKTYRTAYLSLTRGDGGQNLIGPEKGVEIGIIRTQELLEARAIDGAEQYFSRAIDFGYSKTPEDTYHFWDKEQVLSDMVWVIRSFRPDVIITRFPPGQSGGHGHHTASAALALEAFTAAADPLRFPGQLALVQPWKARRIFWNSFRLDSAGQARAIQGNVGAYNPLLGRSYTEISALSRSMHKTQGFGSAGRRGVQYDSFTLVAGEPSEKDLFEGIDTTWNRISGGAKTGEIIRKAIDAFDPVNPSKTVPLLTAAYESLNRLPGGGWITVKRKELREVIQSCAGLWIESVSTDYSASPGAEVPVRVTLVNRSGLPLRLESVRCPECGFSSGESHELADNVPVTVDGVLHILKDAPVSQPYWLEAPHSTGMFTVSDQRLIGRAENAPAVVLTVAVRCGETLLEYPSPLVFRWTDRVDGELYRSFEIRPPVTLNFDDAVCVFGTAAPRKITVRVRGHAAGVAGTVHLEGPPAWKISPASIPFDILAPYGEQQVTFTVSPPAETGAAVLTAQAEAGGKRYDRAIVEISHSHIQKQVYFPKSEIRAVKLDIAAPGGSIGYIMGSGDDIPDVLRGLGYTVTLLDDTMLTSGNLSAYDAIVTGVRAYNTREILKIAQPRLLEYVHEGGTLLVQYNVPSGLLVSDIGPYPLTLGNDRVCEETAPVGFIRPDQPLLTIPNRITAADFEGWVQERGLYFASRWDDRYEPVLSSHDTDEPDRTGGMLYARYGNGVFIYSGYAWFRQLPAGVPGAYRLFVNLIAAGKRK